MGKQLSDMISGQCSPKQHKGMRVAVEGKLTTNELPEILIMEAHAISRALWTRLQGLLQSQILRRPSFSRHGKLCGHGLYRIAVHDPRLFMKNESVTGIDTAAHILLDISGSMTSRIELACAVCCSVALRLAAILSISVGASAFPADYETLSIILLLRHGERV